jgi:HEAT repeats
MQYWNARVADAIGDIGNFQIRRALEAGGDQRSAYCPSRTKIPFDRSVPPLLDSLLSSPNVELRRVAAHALRGICDPSSARFLVGALNDSDRAVQYDAMMGLAALEDFPTDRPAPAASIFNANPAKYLDNWKSWWETGGRQKYIVKP